MNRTLRILFFVGFLTISAQSIYAQNVYIANTSGDPTVLTNWDDVGDGSGANPPNFTSGDYFFIPNGINMTFSSGTLAFDDLLSTGGLALEIETGASLTLNGTANVTFPTSKFHIFNLGGHYTHNSSAQISRTLIDESGTYSNNLAGGSIFTIGTNQTYSLPQLPLSVKFGNLEISAGITVTIPRLITLNGTLTIGAGATLVNNQSTATAFGASFTGQLGTGTFQTNNSTSPPFTAGQTWAGTVVLNRSTVQYIPSGNYNNLNASGGVRTMLSSGTISISGTFTPGSSTYTTTGSTVNFNASGAQNIPALTGANYNNLTITNSGRKSLTGSITVSGILTVANAGGILAINGNTLTVEGTCNIIGSIAGSSASNLIVGGTTGGATGDLYFTQTANDSLLNTFTLSRTGSGSATSLGSNVAITNLLNIANGTFDLNGKVITLKSTSISSTAQVASVGGTITYNNGSFTVERFIPKGNRCVRDLGIGVNTATGVNFFHTWQESGGTAASLGTHITGKAGASPGGVDATTGCDMTNSGATSLWDYVNGVWSSGVTNTKTTKPDVYKGYRITIRGDRNYNLYVTQPAGMNVATTLRANGHLVTGTVTYTTSGTSNTGLSSSYGLNNNNTIGDYSLLANPYWAAINWSTMSKTNLSNTYTVYDPTLGTGGAYVTWDGDILSNSNGSSSVNQYIQPGQGFFVQTSAASPQLVIAESDKATGVGLTNVFRTNNSVSKLSFTLNKTVSNADVTMDGCVVAFDPSFSNAVNTNDAAKFSNNTENISLFNNSKDLAIEKRKEPTTVDTIALRLWNVVNNTNYTITINGQSFTSTLQAFLIDKYSNTERLIKTNDTTLVSFTALTANTLSFANRFYIVFRNNSALPLTSISVAANAKNGGIEVNWVTNNEVQVQSFEVERAADAISFKNIATETAKNNISNNYSVFDKNITTGIWYYRIKIINVDGSFKYSNIVTVNLNNKGEQLTVYPNPVKGNHLNIQINNLKAGNYTAEIYTLGGQLVISKSIKQSGNGNASFVVDFQNKLSAGNYTFIVKNNDGFQIKKSIIVE